MMIYDDICIHLYTVYNDYNVDMLENHGAFSPKFGSPHHHIPMTRHWKLHHLHRDRRWIRRRRLRRRRRHGFQRWRLHGGRGDVWRDGKLTWAARKIHWLMIDSLASAFWKVFFKRKTKNDGWFMMVHIDVA